MRQKAACAVDRSLECRLLTAAEHQSSTALVADWMDLGNEETISQTFPAIFHPLSQARRHGVFAKGPKSRLLSHVATRQARLHSHSARRSRQVLFIGAVATDPCQRGQGLATMLLEQIIQEAHSSRIDSLLLWSELWNFYGRLGFVPAGRQFELCLSPGKRQSHSTPLACIRPATAEDIPALLALHVQKPCRVQRSLSEMTLLLSARPMRTMVLVLGGQIRAYACLGKGLDLGGCWHEMGGGDEDVARLIHGSTHLLCQGQTTVLVPAYRPLLLERLGSALRPAQTGICALELGLDGRCGDEFFVDGLDSI